MDAEKKLEELLTKYIEQNHKMQKELENKIAYKDLYEELLSILSKSYEEINEDKLIISILLNTIYGNTIYENELSRILFNIEYDKEKRKEFKEFVNRLRADYIQLNNDIEATKIQLSRNRFLVKSAHRVKLNLKYHTAIRGSKFDISNIKRIISYFEISGVISNKEELLLINQIELHNRKVGLHHYVDQEEQQYVDSLYSEIPNILNSGFQKHDTIEVAEDRKGTLDNFAQEIFKFIAYLNNEDIIANIEKYKKYNLNENEYNYIIVKLLDNYLEELITFYELLIDKEIYTVRSDRLEIIKKYYYTLDRYLLIRNYYNKITEIEEEALTENNNQENLEIPGIKTLIYAHSPGNIAKTRIINDMTSNFSEEYYEIVLDLLTRFKNDTLSKGEIKTFTNHKVKKGYLELKRDQVRIILKHITDNIYCVVGAFSKKANNDNDMYVTIIKRILPDTTTEEKLKKHLDLSAYREAELENLVKEKARKGKR